MKRIKKNEMAEIKAEKERINSIVEARLNALPHPTITFMDGKPVTSVSHFTSKSINTGQRIQGSNCWEGYLLINGVKMHARKHWSCDNIGLATDSSLTNYIGDLTDTSKGLGFIDGQV